MCLFSTKYTLGAPGYLPKYDPINQVWYPGTPEYILYATNIRWVPGYLPEYDPSNQAWYPGTPEYRLYPTYIVWAYPGTYPSMTKTTRFGTFGTPDHRFYPTHTLWGYPPEYDQNNQVKYILYPTSSANHTLRRRNNTFERRQYRRTPSLNEPRALRQRIKYRSRIPVSQALLAALSGTPPPPISEAPASCNSLR